MTYIYTEDDFEKDIKVVKRYHTFGIVLNIVFFLFQIICLGFILGL